MLVTEEPPLRALARRAPDSLAGGHRKLLCEGLRDLEPLLGVLGGEGEAGRRRRELLGGRRVSGFVGLRRGDGQEGRGRNGRRQGCGGGPPPQLPGWLGVLVHFCSSRGVQTVRGRRADALVPHTPADPPATQQASSGTPL